MAYSSVPIATLSHLIEVLQAACIKCQPQIPAVAPVTKANVPMPDRGKCVSDCPASAAVIVVSPNEAPMPAAPSGGIACQPDDRLVSPIPDLNAIRPDRSEYISDCPASAAVIVISANETPMAAAPSCGIACQPDDRLVSPTPDLTIAAVSSWDSPYIGSQERHQVPDPVPALPPIESVSRLRAKGASPLVKPSVFSLHNPKTLTANRLGSPQVISLAYRHESCSIHIR
ncbi:MAG: hypothetical protein IAE89_08795, partial [Anaerolineae bacterium]|nr:hypothetical protein [Anaerolineae bacterium]